MRRLHTPGSLGIAHVAGRGDALHQCMSFAVDAAGIAQAARRAQLQRHAPVAARGQLEPALRPYSLAILVPGQSQQFAAQASGLRGIGVDTQQETRSPRFMLRQVEDAARQRGFLLLECGRQLLRERRRRMQAGESKPECRQRQHARDTQASATQPHRQTTGE